MASSFECETARWHVRSCTHARNVARRCLRPLPAGGSACRTDNPMGDHVPQPAGPWSNVPEHSATSTSATDSRCRRQATAAHLDTSSRNPLAQRPTTAGVEPTPCETPTRVELIMAHLRHNIAKTIFGATDVTFGIHINKTKTIFGATEHMPSLCKHHLDTADAKRPKHHLDTSRKPPKPQAKKRFHVTFGIHRKQKKQSLEPQSTSHGAQSLEPQSTCPACANTM